MLGLQSVLYHLDVGVSFATLLLPLVLHLDRSSVPSSRIEANVAHRVCSFKRQPLLQQLAPNRA